MHKGFTNDSAGADKANSNSSPTLLQHLPGCLTRDSRTGGYSWKLASRHIPAKFRKHEKPYHYIPMIAGRCTKATTSKTVADACRRRMWAAWLTDGKSPTPDLQQLPSLSKLLVAFYEWNLHTAEDAQARDNQRTSAAFVAARGITKPWEIDAQQIDEWLSEVRKSGKSDRTVQAYRNRLSKFCRFLVTRGLLDTNPAAKVEVRAPEKAPPKYLNDFQIVQFLQRVCDTAPEWIFDAAVVAVYQGPRLGEIGLIDAEDIGDDEMVVHSSKTRDYRVVPIFPEAAGTLRRLKVAHPAGRVFAAHDERWWGELMADATRGLAVFGQTRGPGGQWHLLRSTFAVQRARGVGLDHPATMWELMAWLGHKNPQTTMRYVNIARAAGMDRS